MDAARHRSPRYVAALAVAASLILGIGWLLRPSDIPQRPPPVLSETDLQELARRAERRSLESATAYFTELAREVRPSVAYVPSAGASAVVWDESHLVGGPLASPDAASITVGTATGPRQAAAAWSRRLPLSMFEVSTEPPVRVPRRAASAPQTGEWVVAVWRTARAPVFAAANVRQAAGVSCGIAQANAIMLSIPLGREMTGGGIFNMDRELLGVILPCADGVAAVAPSSVDDMASRVRTAEERLLAHYGLLLGGLSEEERRYFKDAEGLFVREIWAGTPADASSLEPGDLIVAADGHAVVSLDDLQPLAASPEGGHELIVRRGMATETLAIGPADATVSATSDNVRLGLGLESSRTAYRIESVLPESRAARAGVRAGDVLRRINHVEPRTRAQAERAIRSATAPVLLEIEREGRRVAVVVPGSPGP